MHQPHTQMTADSSRERNRFQFWQQQDDWISKVVAKPLCLTERVSELSQLIDLEEMRWDGPFPLVELTDL